jgi:hypothetical protein
MSGTDDERMLDAGDGFFAECEHLTLFVEVLHDGWTAGVYNRKTRQWLDQKRVKDAQEGKTRTAAIAALELKKAELIPNWKPL